jgi:salicylate hydroxylase
MVRRLLPECLTLYLYLQANQRVHVGIIGAGIGGLAAAIAFRRAGVDVTVLEAADELLEVS